MLATKIDIGFNRIARTSDLSDLAELLFPGNRSHQHAFLVIWITLKWADHDMVPNLAEVSRKHGISRRTCERVRAKMRRMGLIERVSRFSPRLAGHEGWVLSRRFERALGQLIQRMTTARGTKSGSEAKDRLLIQLADARKACRAAKPGQSENNVLGSSATPTMDPEVSKSQSL